MTDIAKEILNVSIEDELKKSYLDYSMSVIVSRALPDARDGLKPVHRRVLYAMHELGNDWNKPHKKSARVVGDVIGKYHPHGDVPVYDALVRLAQTFSMRYPLVDGQGNFGSIDGDSPAAMRYTEVRMARLAHLLLSDLEKETVPFVPNYDESEQEPFVLPSQIPNLLINGGSGIAVGMATNIPPHNLTEVIDACIALIKDSDITIEKLMQHIKGPDFPTAAIINGRAGILDAYRTGRGRIQLRAKSFIEDGATKQSIVVTELPYQVNKAHLLEKIADLVKEKKIEGISSLRDESDKDGMRIVIEVKRGENAEVILNNLYAHTQLQTYFGFNMVALDHGQPRLMNLKDLLVAFVDHRREVVTRRTIYDLRKAREKAHLLEGLGIALANIDEIITLIKSAHHPAEAKERLLAKAWAPGLVIQMLEKAGAESTRPENLPSHYGLQKSGYFLSPVQAQAILDLKLHRLTGLEQEKIFTEYQELLTTIQSLYSILLNVDQLMAIIIHELKEIKEKFGDERLTVISESQEDLSTEDLIPEETLVVTLSHGGYVKSQPLDVYRLQRRGGKGKTATAVKEEDFIERLIVASSHDTLLCFTNRGKVYWLKVYQLPQAARQARGKPIVNLLPLESNERVNAVLPIKDFTKTEYVFLATAKGVVKKVVIEQFSRPRTNGIIAIALDPEDRLIGADLSDGTRDVMLFATNGKAIRFNEKDIRPTGRASRGVRGIKLKTGQRVTALLVVKDQETIMTVTENGYGKRTDLEEYRITNRSGQGVISIIVNQRNGSTVGAVQVNDSDEVMLISDQGTLVRLRVSEVASIGRNTQGVRLIHVQDNEKLIAITKVVDLLTE